MVKLSFSNDLIASVPSEPSKFDYTLDNGVNLNSCVAEPKRVMRKGAVIASKLCEQWYLHNGCAMRPASNKDVRALESFVYGAS